MYNTTALENSNNLLEMMIALNDTSNQLLMGMLMLTLFILIFIIFSNYDKKLVVMADSFLLTVLGIFFLIMGLITWQLLIAPILIFIISVIFMYLYS